ncbi:tyrosine recombinase XerC [Bacteroides sp. 214]|uniref:tyrosine recombinase XerC n=1 Tax=Bacteroides sp. 214 TaxID=2302935 RepID=UPI0013D810D0|nr:tyrosine recombinase XerC [Bacteroides sp. 214]NDW13538.1 tyrosine recombinase XerC [Bacteroides sp. 214]
MLIDSFLDYLRYERNYSENTIVGYGEDIAQLREYIQEENVSFDPAEVEPAQIREWVIYLMNAGYAASSVNRKLSSLRSFYRFLLRRGEVTKNPLLKIVAPKKKKALPVFYKESDMEKVLDVTNYDDDFWGCRDRLILEMFYSTGIRLSELVNLNNADVDIFSLQLKVTGKRNKQRLIPFGDVLKELILRYIDKRNEEFFGETAAFFLNKKGERLSKKSVYVLVKKNLSGVVTQKKRAPHALRHTFATAMLNGGAELGAVKDLLGHSSLAATEVYTHTTFEELKKNYKQAHPRA